MKKEILIINIRGSNFEGIFFSMCIQQYLGVSVKNKKKSIFRNHLNDHI